MARRTGRIVMWSALGAALVAGVSYAMWPRAMPVDLVAVARGPLVVTVDEEGETRVRDVFVVSSPLAGRLRRIGLDVGDPVVAGETVVAQIEPSDPAFLDVRGAAEAQAAVRTAEAARALALARLEESRAELAFAQSELERARRLIRTKTIPERAFDEAERNFRTRTAAVATAIAELEMRDSELVKARAALVSPVEAQKSHGACECVPIRAPVDGRILRLVRKSEGVVQAGDALVEIGDPTDLEIVVDFLSTDAVKVEKGQRVIVEQWGGDGALAGRVHRVEPYGFTKVSALGIEEQRVNVVIDLTDPPTRWNRLGHGYRVEVRVVLWDGADVLKVPLTALFRDGEAWAVFVAKDGRARLRPVEVGRRTGLEAEIADGLEPGERVIEYPSDRIAEGVRVRAAVSGRNAG